MANHLAYRQGGKVLVETKSKGGALEEEEEGQEEAEKGVKESKKEAQKLEGSKKKKRSVDSSDSLRSSLLDSSDSSSSSGTSSSDESAHRVVNKGINKKAHAMAKNEGGPELRMINGRRYFKSQAGNWVDCSGPPSRPCAKCG